MPYADPARQREAVQMWREAHPEKVREYKRTSILKKALREHRMPRTSSIRHHALTKDELMMIVARVSRGERPE